MGCSQTENVTVYQSTFDSPRLLEYCPNVLTIAPKMVLFYVNFALAQSRGCTIIIVAENIFQRLQIFADLNDTQQDLVQKLSILVQFAIDV